MAGFGASREFPTTRWTMVLAAGDDNHDGRQALEWLCQRYWTPLYEYARRRCNNPELARDLTQEFLATLIERHWLNRADPDRGRFRAYLLTSLKRFLADQYDRSLAQKRGGGTETVDVPDLTNGITPEMLYERQWAITLLASVIDQLREDFVKTGREAHFETLQPFLTGEADYAQAAAALGLKEGAVRVAVHRLRKQFKQRFHDEIAETVAKPEDVPDEIRYLLGVLTQSSPQ